MKKFILIYYATAEEMAQMAKATPEQKEASIKPWFAWKAKLGDHLVDFGTPLAGGLKIKADGTTEPSTKEVSGYSIIEAENMEQARSLIKGHPHPQIELHESITM